MIQLKELLKPTQVFAKVNVTSKKRALETIAQSVVQNNVGLDEHEVFNQLIERERLGTTGFGNGVAIPHCRMDGCKEPLVVVLTLPVAIDFDAVDDQTVDILIGLVVPVEATEDHLQLLKQIAQLLSDSELCKKMRAAQTSEVLYQLISQWSS